jgi:hypothetical protein
MEKNDVQQQIRDLIEKENRPLDINYVANKLGVHWFTVYKAVADGVLDELQKKHRTILYSMPIVPLKTSKNLLLTPKSMLIKCKTFSQNTIEAQVDSESSTS